MIIDKPIPSQAFIAGEFARIWYPSLPKTCRKCGAEGHLAAACSSKWCFNCEQPGHRSDECPLPPLCRVCLAETHSTTRCPFIYYSSNISMVEATAVSYTKAAEKGTEAGGREEPSGGKRTCWARKARGTRRKRNSTARGRNARNLTRARGRRRNARRVTGTIRTTSAEETAGLMRDGTANEQNDERTEERTRRGRRGVIAIVTALLVIVPLIAITMRNLTLALMMMMMAGLRFAGSLKAGLIDFILF